MRIATLAVRNYRTLEDLELRFPTYYSAICGKNDSGKTNVVRAIRCLMKEEEPYTFEEGPEFSLNDDFTKWVAGDPKQRKISTSMEVLIHPERDTGLHEFLCDYLGVAPAGREMSVEIRATHSAEVPLDVAVTAGAKTFEGLKAQEVLKRLQTSRTFLFHSSTDTGTRYPRGFRGVLRDISEEYTDQLDNSKKTVSRVLRRIAREQQQEIETLLGRLTDKYHVGLSYPTFDLSYFPFNLTLGDKKVEVALDNWGSGTRNRTLVLLTIFRAKQIADSGATAAKVTPVIVLEEPESFLHPLAQAEFGRVLQDLSEDFQVQIIVTTHSPYLLSQARPESNILLERKVVRRHPRQTERIDTSGERWMEPFALSLGIADEEFRPWRTLFFSLSNALLLVEGETDREYFSLLRDPAHGANALCFQGEILSYNGRDALKNQAILRFIKDRFEKLFITFDLDSESFVEKPLQALGLESRKGYVSVGVEAPGKRNIEGLLPDSVTTAVFGAWPDLVQALSGTTEERKSAWNRLKQLLLAKFKEDAVPGEAYYGKFYPLVRLINRALRSNAVPV